MKTGRNDACPCGSGKKYKHCCLAAAAPAAGTSSELMWRRVRRALDTFPSTMLKFIVDVYGPSAIHEAWQEFMLWEDQHAQFDPSTPHVQVFMPWFFHRWAPDSNGTSVEDTSLHDRSPTSEFLRSRGRRLDPVLKRYLEACATAPFSFYEIARCTPGEGFLVRDVFTGEEHEVLERSASRTMQSGDLLFGQLAATDGIVLLEACAPYPISPIHKIELIELRKRVTARPQVSAHELLREWDMELREMYLTILGQILDPALPELRNTDGDLILPHRLVFDIDSVQFAFDALKHLAVDETDDEILESAEHDQSGALLRVQIHWKKRHNRMHRAWGSTMLGRMDINRDRLIGEVNSAQRAAALKLIVERALGEHGRHRATEIQSVEKALAETAHGADPATNDDVADLAELPEVKARIEEMMAAHYDSWPMEKIPALGDRTPLQAIKDPDGREMVEALIRQMERSGREMKPPAGEAAFRKLRERLGLSSSQ